jgi:hypothetical protein
MDWLTVGLSSGLLFRWSRTSISVEVGNIWTSWVKCQLLKKDPALHSLCRSEFIIHAGNFPDLSVQQSHVTLSQHRKYSNRHLHLNNEFVFTVAETVSGRRSFYSCLRLGVSFG